MYPRPEGYTPPNERSLGRKGHYLNAVFVGVFSSAAAGAFAWLFAFGGADGISESVSGIELSSSPPWITVKSREQKVAESAVLTLADLSPGWTLAADDQDDDEDSAFELSEECKSIEEQAAYPGVKASSQSEDMQGPDSQQISSEAAVFDDSDAAQRSLDTYRELYVRCGNDLVGAFNAGLQQAATKDGVPPEQIQIQTALEDLGSANVGESGIMFRLSGTVTGPGGSFQFAVDFIAFRVGRMDGGVTYMSIGGTRPEEERQLLQIAATKLQTANASLSER